MAERRRELILGVLLVVLAVVAYRAWSSRLAPTSQAVAASPRDRDAGRNERSSASAAAGLDVHLETLTAERPNPGPGERNLFRFKPKPPPVRPVTSPAVMAPAVPRGPAGPPPPAPIALKFIGIVEAPEPAKKIAILSDGTGVSLFGKEGDVLAGQYRILKIGVESIEMAYLDGRGRQTIRLSGS